MKKLVTRFVKIKGSGIKIRVLPLRELISLLLVFDDMSNNMDFNNLYNTGKRVYKTIKSIIKKATNLKRVREKHFFIIDLILKVNLPDDKQRENKRAKHGVNTIFSLIDLLASEYSWTEKYILDEITLEKAEMYSRLISIRKKRETADKTTILCNAVHNPNGSLIKSLYKKANCITSKHFDNVNEYINMLTGDINGK